MPTLNHAVGLYSLLELPSGKSRRRMDFDNESAVLPRGLSMFMTAVDAVSSSESLLDAMEAC